jgi:predicted DNA-binding protein (UPF0251 family)/predicted Fe-Mo cluster-binding NifX family protein
MGREKLKRELQFKPLCREFVSKNSCVKNTIELLHEEIEAIYLSDILDLYQEEAAKKMGVSRPTFTRILKTARKKVATMLVSGASLKIIDEKEDFKVVVASSSDTALNIATPDAPFLYIFYIHNKKILKEEVIKNPSYVENKRPGQVLPAFMAKHHINFFLTKEIGEGLKDALLAKGVFTFVKQKISHTQIATLIN